MILVETSLREVERQRAGLLALAEERPELEEWVAGAVTVLDWMRHGTTPPLEEASKL